MDYKTFLIPSLIGLVAVLKDQIFSVFKDLKGFIIPFGVIYVYDVKEVNIIVKELEKNLNVRCFNYNIRQDKVVRSYYTYFKKPFNGIRWYYSDQKYNDMGSLNHFLYITFKKKDTDKVKSFIEECLKDHPEILPVHITTDFGSTKINTYKRTFENYRFTKELTDLKDVVSSYLNDNSIGKKSLNILLTGKSGAGKTHFSLACKTLAPNVRINVSELTPEGIFRYLSLQDFGQKEIIIFDEFDKNYNPKDSKVVHDFLDGNLTPVDKVIFLISNNNENIPETILREGRIDYKLVF